jgi:Na+/phosphate symporter
VSTLVWLLLAAVYIMLFVTLALTTLRKGHYVLFSVGIIFPVLWIIGALMGPTAGAEARGAA